MLLNKHNLNIAKLVSKSESRYKADTETFTRLYGSGQTIVVEPGQMAVVAKLCYDNSDAMTDYFDSHASLSPEFCLLVAPKQAETERLARRGVASCALLSEVEFTWHTEKYSMGHGNYLSQKGGFELPAELQEVRQYYRGGGVTHGHWEIQFTRAYNQAIELPTIAGYGERVSASNPELTDTERLALAIYGSVNGITVTENTEKNGIEIRFPAKPEAQVLDRLKANGWRWSPFSKCWYKTASDGARQFASELTSA